MMDKDARIAELEATIERVKTLCPCGGFILADTEDWPIPMCDECYAETKRRVKEDVDKWGWE